MPFGKRTRGGSESSARAVHIARRRRTVDAAAPTGPFAAGCDILCHRRELRKCEAESVRCACDVGRRTHEPMSARRSGRSSGRKGDARAPAAQRRLALAAAQVPATLWTAHLARKIQKPGVHAHTRSIPYPHIWQLWYGMGRYSQIWSLRYGLPPCRLMRSLSHRSGSFGSVVSLPPPDCSAFQRRTSSHRPRGTIVPYLVVMVWYGTIIPYLVVTVWSPALSPDAFPLSSVRSIRTDRWSLHRLTVQHSNVAPRRTDLEVP